MGFKLFETTFEHCPTGESRAGTHERHTAGSRSRKARLGQRAMAARLARTPADLGSHVGNCLCRTLCGSVLRLRRLSDRLRVMDGPRPVALCTRRLRPALHEDGDQLFVGLGVNVKMFLALLLSGFFMRRRRWIKALLVIYILPWALPAVPAFLSFHWMLIGEQG